MSSSLAALLIGKTVEEPSTATLPLTPLHSLAVAVAAVVAAAGGKHEDESGDAGDERPADGSAFTSFS